MKDVQVSGQATPDYGTRPKTPPASNATLSEVTPWDFQDPKVGVTLSFARAGRSCLLIHA